MRTPLLLFLLLMRIPPKIASSCTSVSPSSSQFFEYNTITVSCQQHGSANWTVWRHINRNSESWVTPCGSDWGTPSSSVCILHTIKNGDSGEYWCVSRYGASCRGINITVMGRGGVAMMSPAVPVKEGQDVPLHCKTGTSASDVPATFFKNGTLFGDGAAGRVTIPNFSASDQGPYWCKTKTNGKESPHSWLLLEGKHPDTAFVDNSEDTSLSVKPNTAQLFEYKGIDLNCGNNSLSLGWQVMRATRTFTSGEKLLLQPCGVVWGHATRHGCHLPTAKQFDTGFYWCESSTKTRSNFVNISVYSAADTQVILSIPATPVTAGENVTLKCEARRQPSSPSATFYRNGNFFRTEPTGGTIISHVALSDEGIYKCEIAGRGDSPSSWLLVTGFQREDDSFEAGRIALKPLDVVRHLLVLFPYCISTARLVHLCRRKGGSRPVSTADPDQLDAQYENDERDVVTEYHF